jgi:hypothetical protein
MVADKYLFIYKLVEDVKASNHSQYIQAIIYLPSLVSHNEEKDIRNK